MTSTAFAQTFSEYSSYDFGYTISREVSFEFPINTHEDILEFQFSPLDEIKKDLLNSGHSPEEVKNVISGLSELPEYATSKRNTKSETTN